MTRRRAKVLLPLLFSLVLSFLPQLFQVESDARVRHNLCDVISQVSSLEPEWPALFPFVLSACSQESEVRVEGLYLLGELSESNESVPSILCLDESLSPSTLPRSSPF